MDRPTISPTEAHVWVVNPETVTDELKSRLSVLSAEERGRMATFRFESDRIAYGAAHLLLRDALTHCAPAVPPGSWELTNDRLERPEVVAPHLCPRLRFNISHTRSLVACLVTREIDCGVDVELRRQIENVDELVAKVLAPA